MNMKLINFPENIAEEAESEEHLTGKAKCLICKHEWIAVSPVGTDIFECPKCHIKKGYLKYPVEREGETFKCNCGCWSFRIMKDGCYCLNCGLKAIE